VMRGVRLLPKVRMTFSAGDRIIVSEQYHWAKGAVGTVVQPPGAIVAMSGGWSGLQHEVPSLRGTLIFYWVRFDQPHRDADGDGPYSEAEIESDYLVPAEGQVSTGEGAI
jgi:hypothetical protein